MAERKSPQKEKKFVVDRFASIEAALRKLKKDELIALLIEAARQDEDACHDLESHLQIDKPVDLLLDDIKSAIGCSPSVITISSSGPRLAMICRSLACASSILTFGDIGFLLIVTGTQ